MARQTAIDGDGVEREMPTPDELRARLATLRVEVAQLEGQVEYALGYRCDAVIPDAELDRIVRAQALVIFLEQALASSEVRYALLDEHERSRRRSVLQVVTSRCKPL